METEGHSAKVDQALELLRAIAAKRGMSPASLLLSIAKAYAASQTLAKAPRADHSAFSPYADPVERGIPDGYVERSDLPPS